MQEYLPPTNEEIQKFEHDIRYLVKLPSEELWLLTRRAVFGTSKAASEVRRILFTSRNQNRELNLIERQVLAVYLFKKDWLKEREEYNEKWGVPF